MSTDNPDLLELSKDILAAFISNNPVCQDDLPELMSEIHAILSILDQQSVPVADVRTAAGPIEQSVTQDYIVSLKDGQHYTIVKRPGASRGIMPDGHRRI